MRLRYRSVSWVGQIRTGAPQLWLMQDEQEAGAAVPQVDLVWYLRLPTGYRVSRVHGTVFRSEPQPVKSPWQLLAQAGTTVGGGMHGPLLPAASVQMVGGTCLRKGRQIVTSRHRCVLFCTTTSNTLPRLEVKGKWPRATCSAEPATWP